MAGPILFLYRWSCGSSPVFAMIASAVVGSLAGSACYAASSVLQQPAAAAQPAPLSMRPGLLVRLLRSPRWMAGGLADVAGYLFHFLALRAAALAVVSPLFVMGLPFSIVGNAVAQHRRPSRQEVAGSAVTVVGLAAFLLVARPGPGHPEASGTAWAALFATVAAAVAGAVTLARGSARRRTLLLATAAGVLFGVTAAVTEHTGQVLDGGAWHTLATWAPYALAVVSLTGLLAHQSAYQAGDLRLSLPIMTVLEPVVAIAIGQIVFGEHLAGGAAAEAGEISSLVVMAAGVWWLAKGVPVPGEAGSTARSVTGRSVTTPASLGP